MGLRNILGIKKKELANAQRILKALKLLDISEEDILKIKDIPQMQNELLELRQFKEDTLKTLRNTTEAGKSNYPSYKELKKEYDKEIVEFNPDAK